MPVIKLTDDVLLDLSSIDGIFGIDTSNLLAQNVSYYSATEDCVVCGSMQNTYTFGPMYSYIDNVLVGMHQFRDGNGGTHNTPIFYPLRRGQAWSSGGDKPQYASKIFGLKK